MAFILKLLLSSDCRCHRRWAMVLFPLLVMFPALAAAEEASVNGAPAVVRLQGLSSADPAAVAIARQSEIIGANPAANTASVAEALIRRAEAYHAQGYLTEAKRDADAAVKAARSFDDAELLARALGSLGTIEFSSGHREQAREAFEESSDLARANGLAEVATANRLNLGNLLSDDEREAKVAALTEAAAQAEALALAGLATKAEINLARFYLLTVKNEDEAATHLDRAWNHIRRIADDRARGRQLLALGVLNRDLARRSGRPREKESVLALEEAAAIGRRDGDARLEAAAWGEHSELNRANGRNELALGQAQMALQLALTADAADLAYRWQRQIGRLKVALGDAEGAEAAYRSAVETLKPLRAEIAAAVSAGSIEFREALAVTYLEYVDLLFRKAGRSTDNASAQALLEEARKSLEQLRSAELENYFGNECIAQLQAQARRVDLGEAGTAVIYPVIFPDRMALLASFGGTLHHWSVAIDQVALKRQVDQLRLNLAASGGATDVTAARALYDSLVRPMETLLRDNDVATLVVVPDGVLRLVPWAALHDGDRYLVDKHAVVIAPSFELIDPQPLTRREKRLLVAALTESRSLSDPPLKFASAETDKVRQLFPATVLEGHDFVQDRLQSRLSAEPYSMVHIASHARFGQSAQQSYITTYDDRLDMNGLEQVMNPTRFRDEPVELIVLSACDTASGDEQAVLGLAGVAVKAGARSALASLWRVDDQASYRLVTMFYQALASGRSKAEALRTAQHHVRSTPGMEHPYYWAPFVIIGSWL